MSWCSGLESLPVLIPSKRDSTLNPDFGFDGGGGGTAGGNPFIKKRAEI